MHRGTLLAYRQPGGYHQGLRGNSFSVRTSAVDVTYQGQGLDHERPNAKVAFHNKARKNTFDLRDSGACGVLCKGFDKVGSS